MSTDLKKLDLIWAHIEEVQRNARKLAERLIEAGESSLAIQLSTNVLGHDQSKFRGIEWDNLIDPGDKGELQLAISHHNRTNPHHPEYWGGIKNMPKVFVAEMVCDWKARSTEFGSSIQEWIEKEATKRYDFSKRDKVWKEIQYFLKLLLEPAFVKLP